MSSAEVRCGFSVIPNGFRRTASDGLFALFRFFGSPRLLADKSESVFAITEVLRGGLLASLASKAVLSNIEPARNVLRMPLWLITHYQRIDRRLSHLLIVLKSDLYERHNVEVALLFAFKFY